jgi:eukaryotic-like serine/threonine-protein kinase
VRYISSVALNPGTRLGPYEIVAPLGAGGMGEVYRARDPRLGREVAIKVLPAHLSANAELRARFEREARAVSSLNHPHICTLHDVGREGDMDFLVMELVEGQTLAERLATGPLPPDEVLRYGLEIVDALDRAHRAGIVHRDLKPGNVMLTKSGAKLMDFGLARATGLAPAPGGSRSGTPSPSEWASLTRSPTIAAPLTTEGTLVGTFQYMSPEQLEGKEADARSDLWALGCVLYEMATGRHAFEGRSQASLIGSIMSREPVPITQLVPLAPPGLDRIVRACLAKDPEERIQTAHDVKLQLQWLAEGGSQAGVPAPVAARRRSRERLAWMLAGVASLVAIAAVAAFALRPTPRVATTRFTIPREPELRNMSWPRVSPDGMTLAFLATDTLGKTSVWVRPRNALKANALPGTEGAGRPFWSPDSRFIAYFSGTQLKKIAIAGGPPLLLCEGKSGADGSWGARGIILFDGAAGDSIRQVSADGGVMTPATHFEAGESQHSWPCFLPDGRHFLYLVTTVVGNSATEEMLKVGSLNSPKSVTLGPVKSRVDYASGYVFFTVDGTLMARRLDERAFKFKGEPFPVAEHVMVNAGDRANFSVSPAGVLALQASGEAEKSELVWKDRTGLTVGRVGEPAPYRDLALSPDGTRLAYSLVDPKSGAEDIWIRDLHRDIASRLTFSDKNEIWPVWSPDGTRIAYTSDAAGAFMVMSKLANGVGAEDTLYKPVANCGPNDWSHDGSTLMVTEYASGAGDVKAVSMLSGHRVTPIVTSSFNDQQGHLSPDGHLLAYTSNESGRNEVYVRDFPGPGGKWQVSTSGGGQPQWREDGRELSYFASDGHMMAVPVAVTPTFQAGIPAALFQIPTVEGSGIFRNRYVADRDGKRFLFNVPLGSFGSGSFVEVLDWTAELKPR